jgi:hypothetical protein
MMQVTAALLTLSFILAVAIWLILLASVHAYRRGYNPIVWALAAVVAMNPIFLFVVLALVPNRSRLRLRAKFAAELDAKLAGRDGDALGRGADAIYGETQTAVPTGAHAPSALDITQTYRADRDPA